MYRAGNVWKARRLSQHRAIKCHVGGGVPATSMFLRPYPGSNDRPGGAPRHGTVPYLDLPFETSPVMLILPKYSISVRVSGCYDQASVITGTVYTQHVAMYCLFLADHSAFCLASIQLPDLLSSPPPPTPPPGGRVSLALVFVCHVPTHCHSDTHARTHSERL